MMDKNTVLAGFMESGKRIYKWYEDLPSLQMDDLQAGASGDFGVICVDMIKGFCDEGALASTRVNALRGPVRELLERCLEYEAWVSILVQDEHNPKSPELASFPAHAMYGTEEAEPIDEIASLSAYKDGLFFVFKKNTTSPAWARDVEAGQDFEPFVANEITHMLGTIIVAGNCTDLCVYQLAMYLKLWANQHNEKLRVIVPANCVDTYDLPYKAAQSIGAMGHLGDFWHLVALYHMALNGIDIVKEVK